MRIVSWNVNGLQATLKDVTHRFPNVSIYFTTVLHADVVCFQESKIQEEKLEKWMACVPGFESFWAFSQAKKGYSGVVTYVKEDLSPLDAAAEKLPGDGDGDVEDLCQEGRILETDHGSFVLINVYVPNAGDRLEGRPRLDFKIRFLQALKRKCDDLVRSGRHVMIVGDFNIAHKNIDVHHKWNVEEIYSSEEMDWLNNFLTEYVDLFRHFHPDVKDVFSVWAAKTEARIHNEGLRIDYAVCDKGFLSQVKDTQILKMVPKNYSDHAAVIFTLEDQPALAPHPAPSISSRNMKRFQEERHQKKLTALFSRGASKPMAATATATAPATGSNVTGEGVRSEQETHEQENNSGNASTSVKQVPGGLESCSGSAGTEDLSRISPRADQPDLLSEKARSLNQGTSGAFQNDDAVESATTAEKDGKSADVQASDPIDQDLDNVDQTLEENLKDLLQQGPDIAGRETGQNGVEHVDDDIKVKSTEEVSVAGAVVMDSDQEIKPEAGKDETPPLKRKQPSACGGGSETVAVANKQRNLTSYFKPAPQDSGGVGPDDDQK